MLYALLVGIDAYPPPAPPLHGCGNDIRGLAAYLEARAGADLSLQTLYDEAATRDAVITGFRDHLGRAGPADVALFAYAGHGSEEPVPVELADLEPTGRIQTLMFYDCNRRVDGKLRRALADKELAVLLAAVAAGGAHVAVILDCCHSGGGTRDVRTATRGWAPTADDRDVDPDVTTPRPVTEFVPGALDQWRAPAAGHVALAACRSGEQAKEHQLAGTAQGAFSGALLAALAALGPRATYRTLLDAVRARVERSTPAQRPELFPLERGGPADGLFLDGTITPAPVTYRMTSGAAGWTIDAGLAHGLRPPSGDEAYVLACRDADGAEAGRVRVTDVFVGSSTVEPVDWTPDDAVAYDAVIAEVPMPPAEVVFDADAAPAATAACAAIASALAGAGPDASPSPFVRVVAADGRDPAALPLAVRVDRAGWAQITRLDGTPVGPPVVIASDGEARLVAARLEHVARWEQVRGLGDHASPLREAVTLEVYDAEVGEERRPPDRPPRDAAGGHRLRYARRDDGTWVAPLVYLDVINRSEEDLFVAVLDLTDRFRCHAILPTTLLGAGRTLALWDRRAIPVELPAGRPLEPGGRVTDWLKVIVSDVDFDATSVDLPSLDEPTATGRSAHQARSTLERMFARALHRDLGGPPVAVARWAAMTVELETTVP